MAVELSLEDPCLWSSRDDCKRLILAEAVNYNDVMGPRKPFEGAPDVRGFIVGQYEGSDLIKHGIKLLIANCELRIVNCEFRV